MVIILPPLSQGLTELAKYPNAFCKISGMFATDPRWNKDSMAKIVLPCIEIFGMDRYDTTARVVKILLVPEAVDVRYNDIFLELLRT